MSIKLRRSVCYWVISLRRTFTTSDVLFCRPRRSNTYAFLGSSERDLDEEPFLELMALILALSESILVESDEIG